MFARHISLLPVVRRPARRREQGRVLCAFRGFRVTNLRDFPPLRVLDFAPMANDNISAYRTRITQIVCGLLFLGAVLLAIRGMMFGSYRMAKLVVAGMVVLTGVLAMDRNYVLLCPILSMYPLKIPGTPFNGAELGAILCVGICFLRVALKKEHLAPFRPQVLLAFPYFFWVAIAYLKNPVGLAILGSSSIGARFYFDIFLGFFVLLTFSRFSLTERQCKILFYGLFFMAFFQVYTTWRNLGASEDPDAMNLLANRAQKYYLDPFVFPVLLLLCHFSLADILSVPWRLFFTAILTGFVVYSGRRTYTGYVFLAPFFLMLLRGKEKAMTLICAGLGLVFLLLVASGQWRLYNLPRSIQRALSPLPGKWDVQFENLGTRDLFREEMKRVAKEKIAADPLFGEGGLRMELEETIWIHSQYTNTRGESGMISSRNWHNKFWGMSADFGLPAGIFWYLFAIRAGLFIWRNRWSFRVGDFRSTLALYYSLMLLFDLVFTMGGSASTPFLRWPQFAFLLALLNPVSEPMETPSGTVVSDIRPV